MVLLDGHVLADAEAHLAGEDAEMLRRFEAPHAATLDQTERRKIYAEAQQLAVDECPLVFMISQELLGASSKKVQGFKLYPNMISPLYGVTVAK